MFGAGNPPDTRLEALLGKLRASPVWNSLVAGDFVLPFAINEEDPRTKTNLANGHAVLWHDTEDAFLSVYYTAFVASDTAAGEQYPGWRTVVMDWPETVMETRTSDPVNPEVGRFWLRTDL